MNNFESHPQKYTVNSRIKTFFFCHVIYIPPYTSPEVVGSALGDYGNKSGGIIVYAALSLIDRKDSCSRVEPERFVIENFLIAIFVMNNF